MPNRRELMQHGIVAATVAAAWPIVGGAFTDDSYRPFRIFYDEALAGGSAFGAAAARRGIRAQPVDGDLGRTWMRTIEPRLARGPVPIAGLTAAAPLFCLEYLARDYGLRVVYRIEHAASAARRGRHVLTGPPELAGWITRLDAAGAHWSACAGELAAECPAIRPPRDVALPDLDAIRTDAPGAVYSWLLAPAAPHARRADALAHAVR